MENWPHRPLNRLDNAAAAQFVFVATIVIYVPYLFCTSVQIYSYRPSFGQLEQLRASSQLRGTFEIDNRDTVSVDFYQCDIAYPQHRYTPFCSVRSV